MRTHRAPPADRPAFACAPRWPLAALLLLWGTCVLAAGESALPATQPEVDRANISATIRNLPLVQEFNAIRHGAPASGDPLGSLVTAMTSIHGDLSAYQTDQPVQDKEKRVVATLDQLIAALQKSCKSGNGNTPGTGRRQSVIANGDPAFGDLHDPNRQGRQWGQLPPKQREQILQSKTEGFPAGYEALLQSYYQRLAQEKLNDDPPADAPATRPAQP